MKTMQIEEMSNRFQTYPKIPASFSTSISQYTHTYTLFFGAKLQREKVKLNDDPRYIKLVRQHQFHSGLTALL